MPTQYPSTLPGPLLDGYSVTVLMGVIKSEMAGHQAQRRVFATMPHRFTMAFMLSLTEWAAWQTWISTYGARWFEIDLATHYAGRDGSSVAAVLVRMVSGVVASPVSETHIRASLEAEIAPSMIKHHLDSPL